MGTKNLGLTQYPNATGNTILANWNSDAEKIDNAITSDTKKQIRSFAFVTRMLKQGSADIDTYLKWNDNGDDLSVIKKEKIKVTMNSLDPNDSEETVSGLGIRITFNKKINILYIEKIAIDDTEPATGVITSITDSTITTSATPHMIGSTSWRFAGTIFYTNID